MNFSIVSAKYRDTMKGVECFGKIAYKGKIVGTFHQKPLGACIPYINTEFKKLFEQEAEGEITDYCEQLLCAWEDKKLANYFMS